MQDVATRENSITRVFVWSRRPLFVDCLSHHFATAAPRFDVFTEAPETLDPTIPTVCIRDVSQRSYSNLEKTQVLTQVRQAAPIARILIISSRLEALQAPDWIVAGAHGYFSTRSTPELLTAATIVVAAGGLFIPEDLARGLMSRIVESNSD